jgi:CheY-like chemotaxis protein
MPARILWVDNDLAYIHSYIKALENHGAFVNAVTTAFEAESALERERYDLVILDVMIPTKSEKEEQVYRSEETDLGLKTGLVFYRRNKEKMAKAQTQILVLTVRLDRSIMDEFRNEGLPPECYSTKMQLREIPIFLRRVETLVADQ